MPKRLLFELTQAERSELEQVRDLGQKPYLREKAAALLKIADGWSGPRVAKEGLLRRRRTDTIYDWVKRYQAEGIAGLRIKPGRGRKPAFSPSLEE